MPQEICALRTAEDPREKISEGLCEICARYRDARKLRSFKLSFKSAPKYFIY